MNTDPGKPLGAVKQFFLGAGLLGRGLGLVLRSPKLLGLGLLPALIAGLLYGTALFFLLDYLPQLSEAVTWFADDWSEWLRDLVQVLGGLALLGVTVLLGVLTFTAVTLLIGDPFYERISELVEDRFGGVPDAVEAGFWPGLRRSLADSLRLIGLSIVIGIPLFLLGFLPVVGQTVIPVIGGAFGGWLLALELTGVPFQRRGQRLRHRRVVLGACRPLALGFGVAVFCCFLIPLGAILMMPAAIAGATLLARQALGHSVQAPVSGGVADHQLGR
ncbi:EI24 domain-containing protein [Actinoplanes sp. LDG1-06]|uniref:EI24 domain-containing protein n=1 Tax=Paractinoplanes ovalisporus TaxID=2810368 RepID=A0ABS2ADM9_9ACTN|nr:EI24 domain-containing protein [Actinoplanes ovalisporus]MBM2617346.1 EI24 domain-containing protein [Actinoplanes ovalisporus]